MFSAADLRPMLATLPPADPPLVDPQAGLRAQVRRHPGDRADRAGPALCERPRLVAAGQREDGAVPRTGGRARGLGPQAPRPGRARRRDCRARRAGPAGRLPAAPEPHSRVACPASGPATPHRGSRPAADRLHRLRPAARRGRRPARAAAHRAPRRARARCSRAHPPPSPALRVSEQVAGDGRALFERATSEQWEGLLVKHARSVYRDGRRSPEWLKLKITKQDEFVVGGWTEPKGTRTRFGSLILGRYDDAGLGARRRRRHRLQRRRARPGVAAARAARDTRRPRSPSNRRRWASRTGCGRCSSPRCAIPRSPTTDACGIRRISV